MEEKTVDNKVHDEFKSDPNKEHIMEVVGQFMYDKYNVRIVDKFGVEVNEIVNEVVNNVSSQVSTAGIPTSIENMNKRAMSMVKEIIKGRINPVQSTTETQQSTVGTNGLPSAAEASTFDEEMTPETFIHKLHLMEETRGGVTVPQVTTTFSHTFLAVHGWDREIMIGLGTIRGAVRNPFVWDMLPTGISSSIILQRVILPTSVKLPPYLTLSISRAPHESRDGELTTMYAPFINCMLIPESPNSNVLVPVGQRLGGFQMQEGPWQVQLLEPDGIPLELGFDGAEFRSDGTQYLIIEDKRGMDFSEGERLFLYALDKKQKPKCTVIQSKPASQNSLVVQVARPASVQSIPARGYIVKEAQPVLLFECR